MNLDQRCVFIDVLCFINPWLDLDESTRIGMHPEEAALRSVNPHLWPCGAIT